jgi:aspartyl-tRNA(Asn)/glutamyl-tRNA(Gln) amidotransferase subunit A
VIATALSAHELLRAFRARELDPVEVASSTLAHIDERDGALGAFVTVTPERALADARRASAAYARGDAGRLAGVPYSLKDLVPTRGIRTARGSLFWRDWVPDFDAPVAERLAAAGGVLLGKTTTPELGWKGDSGNRVNGPARNPWSVDRTAGGSSGGAAAAVAAGFGPLAQGSDGAGSIRIPCAFCGVFGLKPTYGLVPQYPPSAIETLSHVGPMTRTVADAALMLEVMAGPDDRDRTVGPAPAGLVEALDGPLPRLRVAYSPDLGYATVEPAVAALVADAARALAELGLDVEEVALGLDDPFPIVDVLWTTAMAAAFRDRAEAELDLLDPGLRQVVEAGRQRSGVEVAAAYAARSAFCDRVRTLLAPYDLLVTPTLPCTAFPAGDDHPARVAGRDVTYLGWTQLTYPINLTWQPAATVPVGLAGGLPVGMQLVGRLREDATVLRVARAIEEARPWPSPPGPAR